MASRVDSPRQLKVGEQVKHILAEILNRQRIIDPVLENQIISISQVRMSPDLRLASCYFTIFNNSDHKLIQDRLNFHSKYIRGLCSKSLRQLKYMPDFRFYYDDSFDNFTKINNILRSPEVQKDITTEQNCEE